MGVFFVMFRTEGALDPEAVVDELAAAEAADLQTRRAPRDPADTALQGPVPPDEPRSDDAQHTRLDQRP